MTASLVSSATIRLLSRFEARLYARMSPVRDLAYFPTFGEEERGILIGAQVDEQPAGLAAVELFHDRRRATIVSLFVVPDHRRRGIGSALLERALDEIALRGCEEVEASYTLSAGDVTPDRFLALRGWGPARFAGLFLYYSERIGEAPWLRRTARISDAEIVPFAAVLASEEEAIASIVDEEDVPPFLDPREKQELIHADTSFAAFRGGSLAGWCVTQRASRDTLRYASVYVRNDLRGTSVLIALLRASIGAHIARRAEFPYGLQAIPPSSTDMLRFAERRMEPWADRVERMYVRSWRLRDPEN